MRSQIEILEKINCIESICKGKSDPTYVQYKVLVHKLSWVNAKPFLKPEDYTEEQKKQWETWNHCEKEYIRKEIANQLDISAMVVASDDKMGSIASYLVIMTQLWLLGDKYNRLQEQLWILFNEKSALHDGFNKIFLEVANALGFDWERLKKRYPKEEKSNLIIPNQGGQNG